MKNLMTGMFFGAMLGGIVGTVFSDDIYDAKKKMMKKGKKWARKYDII